MSKHDVFEFDYVREFIRPASSFEFVLEYQTLSIWSAIDDLEI